MNFQQWLSTNVLNFSLVFSILFLSCLQMQLYLDHQSRILSNLNENKR